MGSSPSAHIPQQMSRHSEINHSALQHMSTMVSGKEDEVAFPAGNDGYRAQRLRCAKACRDYNNLPEDALPKERERYYYRIIGEDKRLPDRYSYFDNTHLQTAEEKQVFANAPYIKQPLYVDYGENLHIGQGTFINRGCFIADTPVASVRIGSRCAFGPGVHIYSVSHPLEYEERLKGIAALSFGSDIVIGDGCWIGGGVIILPGVHIGKGSVIGAGSVVTHDIPDFHLAVGVPARIVRKVSEGECKQSCCKKTTNLSEIIRTWYAAALPFMVVFIGAALQWTFLSLVMHGKGY